MTENRRIALNVVATYGRSLYALAVGLFTGRWILMSLGETDYGLYGVVGGLMVFVGFLNSLMAQAISRFYAFAVGQARVAKTAEAGVEECRRWFSIAVFFHTVIPVALLAIGYPVGVWAIEHFLTIPADRVSACVWVWRFACLSGFVSMVNVPFSAMYTAKQEIAELTVYSFVVSTLMLGFTYYMVMHPGVWLTKYSAWMCAIASVPQLFICFRAIVKYPECRFRWRYVRDRGRILQVLDFAFNRLYATLAFMASAQGTIILVNKYLGPVKNAAMAIGNNVSLQSSSLANSMIGAFTPAITNAAGACDYEGMRRMALRTCRFAAVTMLLFAIPLALEMDEVTVLWLKKPPEGTTLIAVFLLADAALSRFGDGLMTAILATGRIRRFQIVESLFFVLRFVIAWAMISAGFDLLSVGVAYLVAMSGSLATKVWFGRSVCGISIRVWCREVLVPVAMLTALSVAAGLLPRLLLSQSFVRLVLTTGAVEIVLLPLLWFIVLRPDEREAVGKKFRAWVRV